jgi:hypothetical protein
MLFEGSHKERLNWRGIYGETEYFRLYFNKTPRKTGTSKLHSFGYNILFVTFFIILYVFLLLGIFIVRYFLLLCNVFFC